MNEKIGEITTPPVANLNLDHAAHQQIDAHKLSVRTLVAGVIILTSVITISANLNQSDQKSQKQELIVADTIKSKQDLSSLKLVDIPSNYKTHILIGNTKIKVDMTIEPVATDNKSLDIFDEFVLMMNIAVPYYLNHTDLQNISETSLGLVFAFKQFNITKIQITKLPDPVDKE